MKTLIYQFVISTLASVALLVAAPVVIAKELSEVRSPFDNTGINNDAKAIISSSFEKRESELKIKCQGLDDGQRYRLLVNGVNKARFKSESGEAKLKYSTKPFDDEKLLDFDPRASLVSIKDDSDSVLNTIFNSEGDSNQSRVKEITALIPTALATGGKGEARYRREDGRSRFKVEIEDVPMGDYDLYVAGILRGTIMVGGEGEGEIKFDTQPTPPKLPLDFDPRNLAIDVMRNAEVYFSGVMTAQIKRVNSCKFSSSVNLLASTGADVDASAEVEFETEDDCEREFKVEAEDLPVGDYKLIVDGVVRGTINVADTASGTRGELEFSSDTDEAGKLLLNFDPKDKVVKIKQGSTVYFRDTTNNAVPVSPVCVVVDNEVALINSGVNASAKGKVRFRSDNDCDQDFRVEIEDLPLGNYQLYVGGIEQGDITVSLVDSEPEGEIEFDTDPDEPGEVLLDFDPRGQLIEVRQGGTTYLSRTFPN
ncbi:MAG: hypothetical protein WBN81_11255 [Gammaproteobacteria bacterium]